jgi:hypothetical protein
MYMQAHQPADALAALDRLIDLDPGWSSGLAYAMRARAADEKGDTARVAADLAEACRRGNQRSCAAAAARTGAAGTQP